MRGIKSFLAAISLGMLATAPSAAQAQGYAQQRLIESFDHAAFTATLAETGASWEVAETDDGTALYQVTFEGGLRSFAYFTACDSGKCMGLTLIAPYDWPSGFTTAEIDETIRGYNEEYSAGKALRSDDESIMVQAYVIADHGITMGNLLVQIQVFEDLAARFAESFGE